MSEIANFTLGLIVGLLSMLIVIVAWALMNVTGQKSREEGERGCGYEEVPPLDDDLPKKMNLEERIDFIYDAVERSKKPDPRPEPLPADDDVKSS